MTGGVCHLIQREQEKKQERDEKSTRSEALAISLLPSPG